MDRNFELSDYQKNIINFVRNQQGNLLVDAKAGSGKTSTLIMIADELTAKGNKCLFLAFNKHIVEELQQKIKSPDCLIKTVHSLGYTFIRSYLYKKHNTNYNLEVDTSKLRNLVKEYYDKYFRPRVDLYNATGVWDEADLDLLKSSQLEIEMSTKKLDTDELKELHNDLISDFVGLCNFCRLYNVNYKMDGALEGLVDKFCWHLEQYISDVLSDYQDLVIAVIDKTKELFENPEVGPDGTPHYLVDYTDMIYFPVYYDMSVPYSIKSFLDTIMVDECIPATHFVETENGKMIFRELKRRVDKGEQIKVKTFNESTKQFEYKDVISVMDKGVKPVYEIITSGLNKIQATDNHPFMTQNGWKQLKDLIIGKDYLYLDKPTNQKTKYIPNDDQLQLILGSALGDGSLQKVSDNDYEFRIKFTHSDKQINYLKFKQKLLGCKEPYILKSGYTQKNNIFTTSSKVFLLPYKSKIDFIKHLDLRGLAILYMDDGSKISKSEYNGTRISCNSFTLEETNALINKLKEFGVNSTNIPHKGSTKTYNELHINSENTEIFFKKIAPYMHFDCYYKNPLSTGDYSWNSNWNSFGGNIVKSIKYVGEQKVLDMEVKDNHNFLISKCNQKGGSSILVHNCQDLSILQQKFVQKLRTNFNRFIFVGDKFQSIYSFAGADTHAIEKLDETFILQHLPLNICYRCPENVIKIAQDIVPTIEWNTNRLDKGVVEFVDMQYVYKNIKPNEVLVGRKNKDLVQIYRKFVLDLKKPVKFRNRELVNTLVNNIEKVMVEYMKLYSKGLNIDKPLEEHMAQFIQDTGYTKGTELYDKEYEDFVKKLRDENTGKSDRVARSNKTVSYLVKCMKEYKELGAYGKEQDDQLTEFYDIIMDFINEFNKVSSKILVEDLKFYIKSFLSGSMYDTVPIISSVHSMKGGEADTLYIYNYSAFPYKIGRHMSSDDEQQELNLQYVAITRAKKNLYLVKLDDDDERCMKMDLECKAKIDYLLNK